MHNLRIIRWNNTNIYVATLFIKYSNKTVTVGHCANFVCTDLTPDHNISAYVLPYLLDLNL